MARHVGCPDALIGDTERVKSGIKRQYGFFRRHRTVEITRREEEFRCAIIVVCAEQGATLGDVVSCGTRQGRDPVAGLRPSCGGRRSCSGYSPFDHEFLKQNKPIFWGQIVATNFL